MRSSNGTQGQSGSMRSQSRPKTGQTVRPTSRPAASPLERGVTKGGAHWIGGREAKVVIQEFSDFGCPFCRMGAKVMHQLLAHYGRRIKVVFRHTPITALHPDSFLASEAALAAGAQGKFWPMHDVLFGSPHAHSRQDVIEYAKKLGLDMERFRRDLDGHRFKAVIEADQKEGAKRGVEGTPTFFVTGYGKVEGYLPFEAFRKIVDAQLSGK